LVLLADNGGTTDGVTIADNTFTGYNGYGIAVSAGYGLGGCSGDPCQGDVGIDILNNHFALSGDTAQANGAAISMRTINAEDSVTATVQGNNGYVGAPSMPFKLTEKPGSTLNITGN